MKIMVLSAFILVMLPVASALSVTSPEEMVLGPNKSYNITFSVIGSEKSSVDFRLTPRSSYLSDSVKITPSSVSLEEGTRKVITVTLNTSNISPGSHAITILAGLPKSGSSGISLMATSVATIKFTIPGTAIEGLSLDDLTFFSDHISLKAKNTGKIPLTFIPVAEIMQYGSVASVARGSTEYYILPGYSKSVDLPFSYYGKYTIRAYLEYKSKTTNVIEKYIERDEGSPGYQGIFSSRQPTPSQKSASWNNSNGTTYIKFTNSSAPSITIQKSEALITNGELHIELAFYSESAVDYEVVIEVYDDLDLITVFYDSGHLDPGSLADISRKMPASSSDYIIEATIDYSNEDGRGSVTRTLSVASGQLSITGLLTSESRSLFSVVIIILLIAAILIILRIRKNRMY